MSELSPAMKDALDKAKEAGKLVRWRGGFWTIPNCKVASYQPGMGGPDIPVPAWFTQTPTIQALIKRKKVDVTHRLPRGEPAEVQPLDRFS